MSETPQLDPYRPPKSLESVASPEPSAAPPRLAPQVAAVGVVALLTLALLGVRTALVVVLGLLTFADAWNAGIHKKPEDKGFLNVSAAAWGVAIMLFAMVAYPVYALHRNRLRTRRGSLGLFVAVNVLGCLVFGLILVWIVVRFAQVP